MRVAQYVAPLLSAPGGPDARRDRELVLNERFDVLEVSDEWAFGYAARDGYVGYMRRASLTEAPAFSPTHRVATRQSYLVSQPKLKNSEDIVPLSFGSEIEVVATHESGRWAEISGLPDAAQTSLTSGTYYVPMAHLRVLDERESDPVDVASRFVGTPYHWGGNSGFGIDCSGLVQMACLSCGITCPGDSDMQEAELGQSLDPDAPLKRGDLLFWRGHVAWVAGPDLILHANAHHMAVAYEAMDRAMERIKQQGDGDVTRRARLEGAHDGR